MKNFLIVLLFFLITPISEAQKNYVIAKNGISDFSTISQVNSAALNPGDIVSFMGGERFKDAVLTCKAGVTYTSYGTDQAIIGDSLANKSTPTIQIDALNVTIDNLKIYGSMNTSEVIKFSVGNLTITDCEIIGGYNSHGSWTTGISQANSTVSNGSNLSFQRNKIHGFGTGAISLAMPTNVDIGYNELYDLWRVNATANLGTGGIAYRTNSNSSGTATFDAEYNYIVHHNNIHHFDYCAFSGSVSRVIYEYNEIHHNLDERIYRGGVHHGAIGKMYDRGPSSSTGGNGVVFRYNYVHDLVRRGEANHTYGMPTNINRATSDYYTGVFTGTDTYPDASPKEPAVYIGAVSDGSDWGDQLDANGNKYTETPGALIDGLGYANAWVHNNIFYNCSNRVLNRGYTNSGTWHPELASYCINNTIINCGYLDYVTGGKGVFSTEITCSSPAIFINNIIDHTNPGARTAALFSGQGPYLGYNIYFNQSGFTTVYPSFGDNKATFVQWNATDLVTVSEYYSGVTDVATTWNDTSSHTLELFSVGPESTPIYAPDCRIVEDGDAYNTGKAYNTIGDTYLDAGGFQHELGKDPTGRSFAYDIFGNLRTTNDIGAVGAAGSIKTSPQTGLRVILEGDYMNGKMKTELNSSKLLPFHQPYNVSPWNIYADITINNTPENYVDWILVQIRDDLTNTIYDKLAILTKDGTVLNPDGSPFSFTKLSSGEYYIVIKHRNHLDIMSTTKVRIEQNKSVEYDFTDSQSKAYGENSMADLGDGKFGMVAGDGNADGVVNVLDYSTVANNILSRGYAQGDIDMNGVMNVLDYALISRNILKKTNLP